MSWGRRWHAQSSWGPASRVEPHAQKGGGACADSGDARLPGTSTNPWEKPPLTTAPIQSLWRIEGSFFLTFRTLHSSKQERLWPVFPRRMGCRLYSQSQVCKWKINSIYFFLIAMYTVYSKCSLSGENCQVNLQRKWIPISCCRMN